jgi:hypothetical protein
LFYSLQSCVFS